MSWGCMGGGERGVMEEMEKGLSSVRGYTIKQLIYYTHLAIIFMWIWVCGWRIVPVYPYCREKNGNLGIE